MRHSRVMAMCSIVNVVRKWSRQASGHPTYCYNQACIEGKKTQTFVWTASSSKEQGFIKDLCRAMVSEDFSFHKLKNPHFKAFFGEVHRPESAR
jgi:hypothetical protein